MQKKRTINLTPGYCQLRLESGGFILKFYEHRYKGNDSTTLVLNLHLKFYWVTYLASKLKKVLKFKKQEFLTQLKSSGFSESDVDNA